MMPNKHKAILLIFILLGLAISLIPDIYRLIITPKGTIFPLIHNHQEDYFYYLSLMRQGFEGNILLTTRMTPEHFSPALAQTFFAMLGGIARISGIGTPLIYFLARIIIGTGLLATIIFLAKKVYKDNNYIILASFLAIFSTGFWTLTTDKSKALGVIQYLTHWTKLDPVIRTTYLPHHLLSTILAILSIVELSRAYKSKSWQKGIAAGLLAALGGFIYFGTFINFLGALGILLMLLIVRNFLLNKIKSLEIKSFSIFAIYILFASISFVYLFWLSKNEFPWSAYDRVGENFTLYLPFLHYIYSLGPTFILTLIGLPILFSRLTFLNGFLISWALFPFVGLFVLSKILWRYGNVFYLESSNYIPLGILSVYGLKQLYQVLGRKKIYAVLGMTLLVIYFIPPLSSSVVAESTRLAPYFYNQFIPKDIMSGMIWLDENTPKESVVLSGGYFGNIIPAFTHNRVVYGHPANTYNAGEKIADTNLFFGQKDLREDRDILRKYNVSYIFYAPDTSPPMADFISALPATIVFEKSGVKIYKVDR